MRRNRTRACDCPSCRCLKHICLAIMLTFKTLVWLMYIHWLRISDPCHLQYSVSATLKLGLAAKPRLQTKSMRARLLSCVCAPQSIGGLQSAGVSSQFAFAKMMQAGVPFEHKPVSLYPRNEGTRSSFDVKWRAHGCVFMGVKESAVSLSFPSCSHTPPSAKQGEQCVRLPRFILSPHLFIFYLLLFP